MATRARAGAPPTRKARRSTVLVIGAGSRQPNGAGGPQGNFAAIFAAVAGRAPKLLYSWSEALAAGANARP